MWHCVAGCQAVQQTGYLLVVGAEVKRKAGERTMIVHTVAYVFCPFQKSSQRLKFECAPNRVNVFERGITLPGGLGSVVGIVTAYGLDGPGIESQWG